MTRGSKSPHCSHVSTDPIQNVIKIISLVTRSEKIMFEALLHTGILGFNPVPCMQTVCKYEGPLRN